MSDFDYTRHLPVLDGIKEAFKKFNHHKDLTARIKPILQEYLPEYTISFQVEKGKVSGNSYSIRVWGKDIDYEHPVFLIWSDKGVDGQKWLPGFLDALERSDVRDYLEREEEERKQFQTFALINHEVEALIKKAQSIVRAMPIPSCATVRSGHPMWKSASTKLAKDFPLLFGTNLLKEENDQG